MMVVVGNGSDELKENEIIMGQHLLVIVTGNVYNDS